MENENSKINPSNAIGPSKPVAISTNPELSNDKKCC